MTKKNKPTTETTAEEAKSGEQLTPKPKKQKPKENPQVSFSLGTRVRIRQGN